MTDTKHVAAAYIPGLASRSEYRAAGPCPERPMFANEIRLASDGVAEMHVPGAPPGSRVFLRYDHEEWFSQSRVLARKGWTPRWVRDLLGEPDAYSPNGFNSKTPVRLYRRSRVEAAELQMIATRAPERPTSCRHLPGEGCGYLRAAYHARLGRVLVVEMRCDGTRLRAEVLDETYGTYDRAYEAVIEQFRGAIVN